MRTMTREEADKLFPKRNGLYYGTHEGKDYKYPSITGILGIEDKPFLTKWACNKCVEIQADNPSLGEGEAYKKHFNRDVVKAGERGTYIHNIAPKVIRGESYNQVVANEGYENGLKKFVEDFKPSIVFNERPLVSFEYAVGGTCDLGIKVGAEYWIVDLKTSKSIWLSAKIQLSFYGACLNEVGETFDSMKVIHLPGNGTYSLIDVDEDVEIVRAYRDIWQLRKDNA